MTPREALVASMARDRAAETERSLRFICACYGIGCPACVRTEPPAAEAPLSYDVRAVEARMGQRICPNLDPVPHTYVGLFCAYCVARA